MSLQTFKSALVAAALATIVPLSGAFAQEVQPGQTGALYPDDVVFARQLLMDELETRIPPFDAAAAGDDFDLESLRNDAYLFSTILSVFPHLFPPETKPVVSPDGAPPLTTATEAVWEDFDAFYALAVDAALFTLDMSFVEDEETFRVQAQELRERCDSCHADYMLVTDPDLP